MLMCKARTAPAVGSLFAMGLVAVGCDYGKCQTVRGYGGNRAIGGTVTYGSPPRTLKIDQGAPEESGVKCMQGPSSCSAFSISILPGGVPLKAEIDLQPFHNGETVALPSPDVSVAAWLDDIDAGLPYDAGASDEPLTLVSGTVTVTVTLNNFDAVFDMVFSRANGEAVTVRNGRIAALNASWSTSQICTD